MRTVLSQWKTHGLGVAAIAGVAAGAYGVGVVPQLRVRELTEALGASHEALHAQIEDARTVERSMREELAGLESLGAGWAARRGEPRTLNERLAEVAAVAERHGVVLHTVRPEVASKQAFFTVTPIVLEGSCDYASCASFLNDLLATLPDVTVESIDLRAGRSENGAAGVVAIGLAWYVDDDAPSARATAGSG